MRIHYKKALIWLLILTFCFSATVSAAGPEDELDKMIHETVDSIYVQAGAQKGTLLKNQELLPAGTSGGDWIAMLLAISGEEEAYEDYRKELEKNVVQRYDEQGFLDRVKATEYHRIALTLLAVGGNPEEIPYHDETINLIADGTYQFHQNELDIQGANALIYSLLTLDSQNYQIPENAKFTREDIISKLLSYQNQDGGFGLSDSKGGGSTDITAMAVQSLAPYAGEREDVRSAVDSAISWLSRQMTPNGGFLSFDEESVESVAQVILALCAMRIDPEQAEEFQYSGGSLLDSMNRFRASDGSYLHTLSDETGNMMSETQALMALLAVQKLRTDGSWIFDFEGHQIANSNPAPVIPVVILSAALLVSLTVILFVKHKKSKKSK